MRRSSTTSLRYAFDEANRLTVSDPLDVLAPPRVLEGRVSTDERNRLIYQVEAPGERGAQPGPHRIALDGTWQLSADHVLALSVHQADARRRQTVYLKGAIVNAESNALVFALRHAEDEDLNAAQRITLSGRWEADRRNRLNFLVEKAEGSEDRLTLQGGWELGKDHELLYRYRERSRTRPRAAEHTVIFDGRWDITERDRLVYRLSGSSDSVFEFKASLQSPSLQARAGRLVYQLGIGISRGRSATKRVVLFGTWKLNEDKSVSFEIPYAGGRREGIRFNAAYAFTEKNEVAIELLDRQRAPLGIAVTFSRRMFDDAKWFLRLRKEGKDAEVLTGVQIRF